MSTLEILIVAAERGLGLGLVNQFLQRGWKVFATAQPGSDEAELKALSSLNPDHLEIGYIDVTQADQIKPFLESLGARRFDVMYLNAGIFGPVHQSVTQATDQEFAHIMMTNAFGPARLARYLVPFLRSSGAIAFMSSHRGSVTANIEGGLELYRSSKAALNTLARGIYADIHEHGYTVLSIHPGWAATAMGTLDGTVQAEIDVQTSVKGVADVVESHRNCKQHLYLDYQGKSWPW